MIADPPVGISKICSFGLVQVIAYFSSTSAARNQPPVLPPKIGNGVFPEKVNPGRRPVNNRSFSIGKNVNPASLKFSGTTSYES